jgi:hypothetical protein
VYRILDSVIETGEPVEIEPRGRVLRIVIDWPIGSKVSRIGKRPGLINGNPGDLAALDWSKHWNQGGIA